MTKATLVEVTNTLHECPECGYRNGFHVGFKRIEPNGHPHKVTIQLVCPSCSAVFDIGLKAALELE